MKLQALYKELSERIANRNLTTSKQANKKRIKELTFKRGDRVFLSCENLKTKRQSKKLDNLRKGLFEIEEVRGLVIFKLKLPKGTQKYPVFYKKLLELALLDALLYTEWELEDNKYEPKKICDLRKKGRQWEYLVKWVGWPETHNTWEPEVNLTGCKGLVQEYHKEYLEKRNPPQKGCQRNKKGRSQPVTNRGQSTVRIAMV